MRLLALDPSITRIGLALFVDGRLIDAGCLKVTKEGHVLSRTVQAAQAVKAWCGDADALVVEWPQIYKAKKSKGDPNKIVPLAGVCSAVAALLGCEPHMYLPRDWADNLPKCETVKGAKTSPRAYRIESRLQGGEQIVWARVKYHDAIDAIGIGLKHLGRFERSRVFG